VAFAGPDLDVLVITTASDDHSHPDVSAYPDSGRLFTVRPGVRGVPSDRVSASVLDGHIPIARPE
jgi:sugar lactone lactonase YvrE